MKTEDELYRQANEDTGNLVARLFLMAKASYGGYEMYGKARDIPPFSITTIVQNPIDYVLDRSDQMHRMRPDGIRRTIESSEVMANIARHSFDSVEQCLFFTPIIENFALFNCYMKAIETMAVMEAVTIHEADRGAHVSYETYIETICPKPAQVREKWQSQEAMQIRLNQDGKGAEPLIRSRIRSQEEREQRELNRQGHPYEETEADYLRFLKTNFTNNVRIFGQSVSLQDILDIFIAWPIKIEALSHAHTYIVGRSGSGKSELLKQICRRARCRFVLLDPHGDLADEVSDNSFTVNTYRIAPHEQRFVINPFDIDDKSDANRELVAQEITDLIAELVEDSGLSRLMTTIIFPIVSTLLKLDYADFRMLSDCLNPNTGKERLEALRGLVDPHLRGIWGELEGDTYDTSKQSVYNRLQSLLNYRLVAETLCGRDDFSRAIEPALKNRKNIAVSLPVPRIGEAVAVTIGRFFATRMQIWAKHRQNIPKEDRAPVLLIMDEFHNFMSHATAKTLDQYGRKFGLYMVLAHQHTAQITDREIKGSLLANTANKIVGVCNHDTRQVMAKEMNAEQEDILNLQTGHFVARFGMSDARPVYSPMIRSGKKKPHQFLETVNQDEEKTFDGWASLKQKTKKEKEDNAPRPKFDI